ncbi:MAG: PAS domain S-box protein [Solirubrobacteraceae bacterium]
MRVFGIGRDQALGRAVAELIVPPQLREAHTGGIRRFLADGVGAMLDRRVELTALRGDGTEIPVEITITALREGSEWAFTAVIQDISERRVSEHERERLVDELRRALVSREWRFDAIVGSLAEPITIRDREDRIVYANAAAVAQLGFDSLEALRVTPPEQITGALRGARGGRRRDLGEGDPLGQAAAGRGRRAAPDPYDRP